MRADARRNYDQLLTIANEVVREQGTEASLREIARRAEVGLGTLYRHFPTREALLAALVQTGFDKLAVEARELEAARSPGEALTTWLRSFLAGATGYRGLSGSIMSVMRDTSSPLYASCHAMRAAGERLLVRAQEAGQVRRDVDATDVFALIGALAWIADEAAPTARRREHLFALILDALNVTERPPAPPRSTR